MQKMVGTKTLIDKPRP